MSLLHVTKAPAFTQVAVTQDGERTVIVGLDKLGEVWFAKTYGDGSGFDGWRRLPKEVPES